MVLRGWYADACSHRCIPSDSYPNSHCSSDTYPEASHGYHVHPHTNPDSIGTNADSRINSHSSADSCFNAGPIACPYTDSYANASSSPITHPDSIGANAYFNADSHTDAHTSAYFHTTADGRTYGYGYSYTNPNSHTGANSDTDGHSN